MRTERLEWLEFKFFLGDMKNKNLDNFKIIGEFLTPKDVYIVKDSIRRERQMALQPSPGEIPKPILWEEFAKLSSVWINKELLGFGLKLRKIDTRRIHLLSGNNMLSAMNRKLAVRTTGMMIRGAEAIYIDKKEIKTDAASFHVMLHEMIHSLANAQVTARKGDLKKPWPLKFKAINQGLSRRTPDTTRKVWLYNGLDEAATEFIAKRIWCRNRKKIEKLIGHSVDDNDLFDWVGIRLLIKIMDRLSVLTGRTKLAVMKEMAKDYFTGSGKFISMIEKNFEKEIVEKIKVLNSEEPSSEKEMNKIAAEYVSLIKTFKI